MSTNAIGLQVLSDELLLLVVSFFPTNRIPEETRELLDNGLALRHKTLLALTMTCRPGSEEGVLALSLAAH